MLKNELQSVLYDDKSELNLLITYYQEIVLNLNQIIELELKVSKNEFVVQKTQPSDYICMVYHKEINNLSEKIYELVNKIRLDYILKYNSKEYITIVIIKTK